MTPQQDAPAVWTAGCLCGAVRYEITGPPTYADWCYCSHCRKVSGAAGDPCIGFKSDDVRLVHGRDHIRVYPMDGSADRHFCTTCGSPAPVPGEPGTMMGMSMGLLDQDVGMRPLLHKQVAYMAPWHTITDDLPQFAEFPTGADLARLGIQRS